MHLATKRLPVKKACITNQGKRMASKKSPVEKREEVVSMDDWVSKHQPVSNGLKIKLDHLKTIINLI